MAEYKANDNIIIENAQIIWKNFSGEESQYNRAGKRTFCVIIEDPEDARNLSDAGWNVKVRQPRDIDEEPTHYIQVETSYRNFPPHVYMFTRRKKTLLTEETIGCLDHMRFKNADIVIRPYNWDVNGKVGVKAYLKELYVTVEEDYFADKYAMEEYPGETSF